jgi:anti-anti-sigma factor
MTIVLGPSSHHACALYIEGPLHAPVNRELRHRIRTLLRRGERTIVLDLARVPRIDAAGVGELVRAYNMTIAPNGVLKIVHASAWVREILERVGLLAVLTGSRRDERRDTAASAGSPTPRSKGLRAHRFQPTAHGAATAPRLSPTA